jgi:hypothetical protein
MPEQFGRKPAAAFAAKGRVFMVRQLMAKRKATKLLRLPKAEMLSVENPESQADAGGFHMIASPRET